MSSSTTPTAVSSLIPQHSPDLASELSSHLNSALASDLSYSQMNDAKMRGISSMVGWDQFHGMVLTAHLQPVNLRQDPLDEMAKGIARNKKLEQLKTKNANNYAIDHLTNDTSANTVEDQLRNSAFLTEFDLAAPQNGLEFARDWKKIGSNPVDANLIRSHRYRYLLTIPTSSLPSVLKGGIPLEMISSLIDVIHWKWLEIGEQSTTAPPPALPSESSTVPTSTTTAAPSESTDASAISADELSTLNIAATTAATPSSSSQPTHQDVCQLIRLIEALTATSTFAICIFSLTKVDKAKLREIFEYVDQRIPLSDVRWDQRIDKDAVSVEHELIQLLRTKFKVPT